MKKKYDLNGFIFFFVGSYKIESTLNNGKNHRQKHNKKQNQKDIQNEIQNDTKSGKIDKNMQIISNSINVLNLLHDTSIPNNVPSIPSKNQCYGYEVEKKSGKLILQNTNMRNYKGTKEDNVGPGEYNPNIDSIMKNKIKASFAVSVFFI